MTLKNKIDFVLFVSVKSANPNGDPLNGNRPRVNYDGFGEISDVCIKRKIRNRMMDLGKEIFVQSDDKRKDEYMSLSSRAGSAIKARDDEEYARIACEKWLDVRTFGQVFAFGKKDDGKGVSIGVRGPVSINYGSSCSPIDIESMQIVKSVNGEDKKGKSSDTMGLKHTVPFGLYEIKGAINVQLAEKAGFSEEDADIVKECLRTLFVNDSSSARPDGSMEVCRLYWWKHNCELGQYSSAKVHRSVKAVLKEGIIVPRTFEDYVIELEELEGLKPEIINGL